MTDEADDHPARTGGAAPVGSASRTCNCGTTRYCGDCALAKEREILGHGVDQAVTALCLSGGGIRSAAFCLGVIQVLAGRKLLQEFDYLSTVSGGGFIGAWLVRSLAALSEGRLEEDADVPRSGTGQPTETGKLEKDRAAFFEGLNGSRCEQVTRLRRFTNYLTPRPGLASADTWTAVLLWGRNTLVNWAVFLPLSLAVAAVAVAWFTFVCDVTSGEPLRSGALMAAEVVGLACFAAMVFSTLIRAPNHGHPDRDWVSADPERFGPDGARIRSWIIWPAVGWCFLASVVAASLANVPATSREFALVFPSAALENVSTRRPHDLAPLPYHDRAKSPSGPVGEPFRALADRFWDFAALPSAAWVISILAYCVAWIWVTECCDYGDSTEGDGTATSGGPTPKSMEVGARSRKRHRETFLRNFVPWVVSSLASSSLLLLGILVSAQRESILLLAFVGPLWVAGTEVIRSTCYVAIRRDTLRGELDREWLARINASKLVYVTVAMAVGSAAVVLPTFFAAPSLAVGLVASGPLSAVLGRSARTSLEPSKLVAGIKAHLTPALACAALAFAALLLAACGIIVTRAIWALTVAAPFVASGERHVVVTGAAILVAAAATVLALVLGHCVDLGNYSMHAVYRNRLVRAFLGTARPQSHSRPDLYTGFDGNDDTRVAHTFDPTRSRKLFPVINIAANATSGGDAARAERKAASFTVTPLSCGWFSPDRTAVTPSYVDTKRFDGREQESGPRDDQEGITLGRAMALSGAAVSPNMGYHSSPLVAFVMTLFNVRLGAWLPNPAYDSKPESLRDGRRANEVKLLLQELFGASDLKSEYVYLSDGGHFDNLGLYEMLRRRCSSIIIVDAAQDGAYGFEDLGRTLTKAFVDFGIKVDLEETIDVGNKSTPMKGGLAQVTYPARKGGPESTLAAEDKSKTGFMLYLKPWMPDGVPVELRAFKARRDGFPHDVTANQFFAESDFESYRRLGEHLASQVLRTADERIASAGGTISGLADLFKVLASMAASKAA